VKWRGWLLIAVLGAAVVAGAFLLPRSGGGHNALIEAARRTLTATSYRSTFHGASQTTSEDYEAPHRLRLTSGAGFDIVMIGSTVYAKTMCTTPDGTETGYRRSHLSTPAVGSTFAFLGLVAQARDARSVGDGRYAFSVRLPVPNVKGTKVRVRSIATTATVAGGKVRAVAFSIPKLGTTRITLSRFGHVPRIERPTGPWSDNEACTFGVPDLTSKG
jgi:hypothetical protein